MIDPNITFAQLRKGTGLRANPSLFRSKKGDTMIAPKVMQKLSYGVFVLTARDGNKDNGCIINTVTQVASEPNTISISVNKADYTHDMIMKTGNFNVSILSEKAKFATFKHFGFQSGRDVDKFEAVSISRTHNGIAVIRTEETNAFVSGHVIQSIL